MNAAILNHTNLVKQANFSTQAAVEIRDELFSIFLKLKTRNTKLM